MHTSIITDEDDREWTLHHNGGYDGEVWFTVPDRWDAVEHWNHLDPDKMYHTVKIPFEVLEELVGRKQIAERIAALEQLTGKEFLDVHRTDS